MRGAPHPHTFHASGGADRSRWTPDDHAALAGYVADAEALRARARRHPDFIADLLRGDNRAPSGRGFTASDDRPKYRT